MDTQKRAPKRVGVDYKNGKIYKIVNDVNEKIYIGSTTQPLHKRMHSHRTAIKTKTSNLHSAMKELGVEHFQIILIEDFPCASKRELEAREYAVLDTFDKAACYNSIWNGKYDETARAKMSANNHSKGKFGEESATFKRGSVSLCKSGNGLRWKFSWHEDGKKKSKNFNIYSKRTTEQAYLAAIDYQQLIYPLKNRDYLQELPIDL